MTDNNKGFLANAHWLHAMGLGAGYYYAIDKNINVAGGITAGALLYMTMYGHGLPMSNEKKPPVDHHQAIDDINRHHTLESAFNNYFKGISKAFHF